MLTARTSQLPAARRWPTFNRIAKISTLGTSARCHTMSYRPQSFSWSLPCVRTRAVAAQPSLWDAAIGSESAPEIGFFAFWRTPLWETENVESVQ